MYREEKANEGTEEELRRSAPPALQRLSEGPGCLPARDTALAGFLTACGFRAGRSPPQQPVLHGPRDGTDEGPTLANGVGDSRGLRPPRTASPLPPAAQASTRGAHG